MEKSFHYVYMNQDGALRELSLKERDYLSQEFLPGDGGRPYIKNSVQVVDGWGSKSGFLPRKLVPYGAIVEPVNPDFDTATASETDTLAGILADHQEAGNKLVRNANGSITVNLKREPKKAAGTRGFLERIFGWNAPTSDQSTVSDSFESMRSMQLKRQAQRENLARYPNPPNAS